MREGAPKRNVLSNDALTRHCLEALQQIDVLLEEHGFGHVQMPANSEGDAPHKDE